MKEIIVIKYGEIALKGKNRYFFENALMSNIRKATGVSREQLKRHQGRLYILPEAPLSPVAREKIYRGLAHVFGIVAFAPAQQLPVADNLQDLKAAMATFADCSKKLLDA